MDIQLNPLFCILHKSYSLWSVGPQKMALHEHTAGDRDDVDDMHIGLSNLIMFVPIESCEFLFPNGTMIETVLDMSM